MKRIRIRLSSTRHIDFSSFPPSPYHPVHPLTMSKDRKVTTAASSYYTTSTWKEKSCGKCVRKFSMRTREFVNKIVKLGEKESRIERFDDSSTRINNNFPRFIYRISTLILLLANKSNYIFIRDVLKIMSN